MLRTIAGMLTVGIALVVLLLAGCGGTGTLGTGSGMLFVTVHANVLDLDPKAVAIFDMASARDGDSTPDRYLEGARTGFLGLTDRGNHVVEEDDDLYLADGRAAAIWIFSPATSVNGNHFPTRVLYGDNVPITWPLAIAVDTSRDILYVLDEDWSAGITTIYVWDSAATVNGNVAPDRTITGLVSPFNLVLDQTNDRLYLSSQGARAIEVVNDVSTLNGTATVARSIVGAATQIRAAVGIALDRSRDRLYVADIVNGILVFDSVDTIDGNVAPLNVISGAATGLNRPRHITLDRQRDHIYVVNDYAPDFAIRVWHNASGADGNLPPNRIISNSAGLLSGSRALSFISQ